MVVSIEFQWPKEKSKYNFSGIEMWDRCAITKVFELP